MTPSTLTSSHDSQLHSLSIYYSGHNDSLHVQNPAWTSLFHSHHKQQVCSTKLLTTDSVFSAGYSSKTRGTERLWRMKSRRCRKVFDIFSASTSRFGSRRRHSNCSTSRCARTVVSSSPSSSSFCQKFSKHTTLKYIQKCSLPTSQLKNTGKHKYKPVGDWISVPSPNVVAMATRVGPTTLCMVQLNWLSPKTPW